MQSGMILRMVSVSYRIITGYAVVRFVASVVPAGDELRGNLNTAKKHNG